MSRIGKRKLIIPEGVTVEQNDYVITVKGPKGSLTTNGDKQITYNIFIEELKELSFDRKNENIKTKAMHGTINANVNNMIIGVTEGYTKALEIIGVGYRFTVKGNTLVVSAGYSHPVEITVPEGLIVESVSNTEINVKGI